jgi:hypothetical protein
MADTSDYDPKKAALWNQLRQGGMSEDEATKQAGISAAETENYAIGMNGQMGAFVIGFPASGKLVPPGQIQGVSYDETPNAPPSSKTPTKYTTTSTETVSGGGSTTITAGVDQPTAASRALQPAIDAKQAEIEQFNKDNPSNFARKKLGLPPLTPEENQARNQKALELSQQKVELSNQQASAMIPGTPTITTVPNTTTTTTTVTSGTSSVDTAVQSPGGSDPAINRQTETTLGVTVGASNVQTTPDAGEDPYVSNGTRTVAPESEETIFAPDNVDPNSDPFEQARYEASLVADVPATDIVLTPDEQAAADDPFEQRRLELEQEANRAELAQQENLNVGNDDPASERNDAAAVDAANAQPAFGFNPDSEEIAQAAAKSATLAKAQLQNTVAKQRSNPNNGDWRVKLRLAPGAKYLYNDPEGAGILTPLKGIGIIFPYTPTISTSYKASYASYDLTHSNYRGYYYQNSAVEPVTLSCPFTAQSTVEAEYLLAVIHFFKSVTKMFYGQDAERGTPPPLVYLTGLGEFQFNEHPCVVQSFTYELPAEVDYIRARSPNVNNSNMLGKRQSGNSTGPGTTFGGGILGSVLGGAINRLAAAGLPKGGITSQPAPASFGQNSPTYVPTKMNISISLLPVQSRKQQSQVFSLKQYANGELLKGGFW